MPRIFQVDSFSDRVFGGNPAAVVPFSKWPADDLMQSIANENNLAETAFIVHSNSRWELRWFTPTAEVALCGHATLAAAHVVFNHLDFSGDVISFVTRESGTLDVSRLDDGRMLMSFPAINVEPVDSITEIEAAMNSNPVSVWKGYYSDTEFDYLAVYESASDVAELRPETSSFAVLGSRGVIATSLAEDYDFVSRYFAPEFGVPEDPVTGSAHCLLAPYWAKQLDKDVLLARQISARGGTLECRLTADRVEIVGHAIDYMQGELSLPI